MARDHNVDQTPIRKETPRLTWKNWLALGIVLAGLYAWQAYASNREAHPTISYSAFHTLVAAEKIESLTLRGQDARGQLRGPELIEGHTLVNFKTMIPATPEPDLLPL